MTIARRPRGNGQASEARIAALIDKGGGAAGQKAAPPNNLAVPLLIPGPRAERLTRAPRAQHDPDARAHMNP